MFKSYIAGCLITAGLLLTGCGGPEVITIQSVGDQMAYDRASFRVSPGQEVRLVMKNLATMDMMKHNIVILESEDAIDRVGQAAVSAPNHLPDDSAIIVATPIAGPGETTEVTFTAPSSPGKYPFICTFPGHYLAMQGVMIVE